ncbi:MAG: F0F1 ATP synthase subunit B [Bacteroidales bacterium]|nr:F0F1 ATP synthase subunit B [Bacteroidales bacterium]
MDLVTPGIGMIFWSTLFFLILLFILGKFAWPAILAAVRARNESIRKALESAEKARKEMEQLHADNEKVLAEAKTERDAMMKEARDVKDKIISEAREKANAEAAKLVKNARNAIQNEKLSAITEMKEQMAILSVQIAEKILKSKLSSDKEQEKLAKKLIDDIKLN